MTPSSKRAAEQLPALVAGSGRGRRDPGITAYRTPSTPQRRARRHQEPLAGAELWVVPKPAG